MSRFQSVAGVLLSLGLAQVLAAVSAGAESSPDLDKLQAQNQELRQQVQSQQRQIDELRARMDAMQNSAGHAPVPLPVTESPVVAPKLPELQAARAVRLSGEVGLAFFDSGENGLWPNSEFRVDDAKIYLEAPVWENVYLFTGMELATREAADEYFHVGELYADVEDLITFGPKQKLSLRVGRFYIPFGEEYQHRGVMDDPLITHSLADIWGIDEGAQIYGTLGGWQFNLAVQNGGHKTLHDFNPDKAVVARVSVDATPQLHLSASAMRTGKLDTVNDGLSEVWLANAFFRALGSAATTKTFEANLAQLDAQWHWKTGHLNGTAGWARFDDDSTVADNSRTLNFQSIELMQQLTPHFFGAMRYGELRVPGGYPLAGLGNAGKYFYNPFATLTTRLDRLSLGVGYRFASPLVWKMEYSWENGRLVGGAERTDENLFSSILGLSF